MKTRVLSGMMMLPLLIFFIFGGPLLDAFVFLLGVLAMREFFQAHKENHFTPSFLIGVVAAVILYGIYILKLPSETYFFWIFICVFMCLISLFQMERRNLADAQITLLGIFYPVFFSFHIVLINGLEGKGQFVWMVLITAMATDIMAYFSGYFFGKHKLCPTISPKKTIEGAIGGTIFAVIASGVFGYFFTENDIFLCLLMGLVASIFSQLGDLSASVFKRKLGIKDYGNLIPGHGGVLDRIDSILFTAPVVYYFLVLI